MSSETEREAVIESGELDWAISIAERAAEVLDAANESRDRDADIQLAMMLQELAGACRSQAERIAGTVAQEIRDSRAIVDAEVAERVREVCSEPWVVVDDDSKKAFGCPSASTVVECATGRFMPSANREATWSE
jgi:hypothetical protein